jgi:hypothetical protein
MSAEGDIEEGTHPIIPRAQVETVGLEWAWDDSLIIRQLTQLFRD